MTTVIDTLTQLASNASLQTPAATEQLLSANNIEEAVADAILAKDVVSLERQLDVCPDIACLLVPAEDDEEEKQDDKDTSEIKSIVNG